MQKILGIALILGATVLTACPPMQQGMMNEGMMQKCECDKPRPPKPFDKLGLSDEQKMKMQKIREEDEAFRDQQHKKMVAILTPEQRKILEENAPRACPPQKEMKGDKKMSEDGMGCKNCPTPQ